MKKNELIKYRDEIDKIDNEMLKLFLERIDIVKKIGLYKEKNQINVGDNEREQEIIKRLIDQIDDEKLKDYYLFYLDNLFKIAKNIQKK